MSQALAEGRESVLALENALRHMPQVDLPLTHFFIPGVYVRVMTIPAGVGLVGKIHKHPCISILAQGAISIRGEGEPEVLRAPFVIETPPGTKRAGYALTDVTFITVHRTDETDLPELERELVCNTFEEYETFQLTHEVAA